MRVRLENGVVINTDDIKGVYLGGRRMKVTIEGDAKEIAELLATTIRHSVDRKPFTYGDWANQYKSNPKRSDGVSSLDLPVVVALSELRANQSI